MISYSAAGYWIDTISGSTPQTTAPGEVFPDMQVARPAGPDMQVARPAGPDMQVARSAGRRNRLQSAWTAIVGAPHFVTRQAARLVPASLSAALTARAEARLLARDIKRLQDLAPHLLWDIGIEQVVAGHYMMIETGEPVAEARPVEPAVIRIAAVAAARPVKAAPQRTRPTSTRWPAAELAGGVMP